MDVVPKVYYGNKSDTGTLFDEPEINIDLDEGEYIEYSLDKPEQENTLLQDDFNKVTNLSDITNIKTIPLKLKGKSKLLLNNINSPFSMLIWGKQGELQKE
ncbi:MAG TPA: hypothetical protein PLE30_08350 [Candidatus Kapabacteria bacterium]|nr:hypothetical protein [Candidatus Kapabacteria bacterium]